MNGTQARDAICAIGESLCARGYVHATAGNISVRLEDGGFLITPTDACLGRLQPERLARLDASGRQLCGDRGSKTIAAGHPARSVLHTMIQRAPRRCWSSWRKLRGWPCLPGVAQCRSKPRRSRNCATPSARSGSTFKQIVFSTPQQQHKSIARRPRSSSTGCPTCLRLPHEPAADDEPRPRR